VIKAVTFLGSDGVLWTVIGVAAVLLALRKRWWLALYLLVTGAGALVLDPVLKSLVGRLRPVVAHPIAYGTGDSFPSGHSLGSIVCYGAVLLVLDGMPRWLCPLLGSRHLKLLPERILLEYSLGYECSADTAWPA
jgi:undecaprenyl-diphosphatase